MHHEPARRLLALHGAPVDEARQMARIPRRMIDEALAATVPVFTLCSVGATQSDCHLGRGDGCYARTGSGLNWIVDRGAQKRRLVTSGDLDNWIRVVDALSHIHIAGALYDNETRAQAADVRAVAHLLRRTAKPLMMSAMSGEGMRWIKRLVDIVQPSSRPQRLMMLSSVNSPLTYGAGQLEAAMVAAELGIPVVINSSAVTGITAPVTLAGSLVQMHAEMLAALVIVQLHRPGAPLVYSGHPVVADMRNGMAAMGTPEVGLLQAGCVDLARYCGLPAGSDGLTADSCVPDQMAVSEKWASAFLGVLAGANVNGAAGVFATQSTVSLEQLVLDDEIYATMFRMRRGFAVTDETLAVARHRARWPRWIVPDRGSHGRPHAWRVVDARAWPHARERLHGRPPAPRTRCNAPALLLTAILGTQPEAYLTDEQEREVTGLVARAESALQNMDIPA